MPQWCVVARTLRSRPDKNTSAPLRPPPPSFLPFPQMVVLWHLIWGCTQLCSGPCHGCWLLYNDVMFQRKDHASWSHTFTCTVEQL